MIGRLRWLYFLHYAGVGTFLSYFAPYLRGLGFSGEQIGAVTFAQQAVAAPAALIWGGIADRLGAPARALSVCTAGMLFAICGLPFARTPSEHTRTGVFVAASVFARDWNRAVEEADPRAPHLVYDWNPDGIAKHTGGLKLTPSAL